MRARLDPLIAATKADEVMVTTMIHDHGARRHSYEVLAKAFGLAGAVQPAAVPHQASRKLTTGQLELKEVSCGGENKVP